MQKTTKMSVCAQEVERGKLGVSLAVHQKNKAWLNSNIGEVLVLRKKKRDREAPKITPNDSKGMGGLLPNECSQALRAMAVPIRLSRPQPEKSCS